MLIHIASLLNIREGTRTSPHQRPSHRKCFQQKFSLIREQRTRVGDKTTNQWILSCLIEAEHRLQYFPRRWHLQHFFSSPWHLWLLYSCVIGFGKLAEKLQSRGKERKGESKELEGRQTDVYTHMR